MNDGPFRSSIGLLAADGDMIMGHLLYISLMTDETINPFLFFRTGYFNSASSYYLDD